MEHRPNMFIASMAKNVHANNVTKYAIDNIANTICIHLILLPSMKQAL